MNKDVILKTGFNLYLLGLALPIGLFFGLASFPLWMFSFAFLFSYHLINHFMPISLVFKYTRMAKTPQYLLTAFLILTLGTSHGLTGAIFGFAVMASPFIFDGITLSITVGIAVIAKVLNPQAYSDENQLYHALLLDDDSRVIQIIDKMNDPQSLVKLGLKVMHESSDKLFNSIIARLKTLGPHNIAFNDNQLLRAAIYHKIPNPVQVLLAEDSVKANIHFNHNEAARLAQQVENWEVLDQLLALPAVANYQYPANIALSFTKEQLDQFGQAPVKETPSQPVTAKAKDLHVEDEQDKALKGFVARGVYADVDVRQKTALDDMENRYRAKFNQKGGVEAIFGEIKTYLEIDYAANPAKIFNIPLPLNLGKAGLFLTWLMENTPIYQHPGHCAYRYLFIRPNPWRSLFSNYTNNISDQDKSKIAYMWLAATDKNQKLPEGQTRESLINEFKQAFYEICRTYNNTGTHDNLLGDQTTCTKGVNQRINQFYMVFLNDRPETRPLTAEVMRKKFQEEMIDESKMKTSFYNKLKSLDQATLTQLEEILSKKYVILDDTSDAEDALLKKLEFTLDEIKSFVEECKKYFGPKRITDKLIGDARIRYQERHRFSSYDEMIKFLAKNFYEEFYSGISRNITNLKKGTLETLPAANDVLLFSEQGSSSVAAANDSPSVEEPAFKNRLV